MLYVCITHKHSNRKNCLHAEHEAHHPLEWGSAVPARVPAVSSSARLISNHSIGAPVITKTRRLAHVGRLMSYK